MTRRRIALVAALTAVALTLATLGVLRSRMREGRLTTQALEARVTELRAERDRLRPSVHGAMAMDPRLAGMPDRQVRVGIPTSLAGTLVTNLLAGVPDHLTLQLGGFRIHRAGEVRRVVPLGEYDLTVRVTRVTARLATGEPDLRFGGNRIALALPVRVASGRGTAAIDFRWDGRTVGGAVCGDMRVTETVTGTVRPATYRLTGALHLSTTPDAILVTPRLPALRINVRVEPTKASWDLVQQVLDSRGGLCGFVLDRVNIRGALEELLAKGFSVRLPTERLGPIALPIGLASTVTVRGTPIRLGGTAGTLTITDDTIWLGANVTLETLAAPTVGWIVFDTRVEHA